MTAPVSVFNSKEVDIVFGPHRFSGFAAGSYVTAERTNDAAALVVGADGEAALSISNDKSGTVTSVLLQTSATNDFLSAQAAALENGLGGILPLMVKDNSGRTLIQATTAWVKKVANFEGSRDITDREWVLETGCLNMFVGGN